MVSHNKPSGFARSKIPSQEKHGLSAQHLRKMENISLAFSCRTARDLKCSMLMNDLHVTDRNRNALHRCIRSTITHAETKETYTPLARSAFYRNSYEEACTNAKENTLDCKNYFMATSIAIAVPLLLGVTLIYFLSKLDDRLVLRDYTELKEFSSNPNSRKDEKTLPFLRSISTDAFWFREYDGQIPSELRQENIIIAANQDGFIDILHIGLFKLSNDETQHLSKNLVVMFKKEQEGTDINSYTENALCLNSADLGHWAIASTKKQDFFDFCLEASKTDKIKWELFLREEDGIGFKSIDVTQYIGENFFTVTHGSS